MYLMNEQTEDVMKVLSDNDDTLIRNWVHEVWDQHEVKDQSDKTCEWVKGIDELDNLKVEHVQWGIIVDFLLDNIT